MYLTLDMEDLAPSGRAKIANSISQTVCECLISGEVNIRLRLGRPYGLRNFGTTPNATFGTPSLGLNAGGYPSQNLRIGSILSGGMYGVDHERRVRADYAAWCANKSDSSSRLNGPAIVNSDGDREVGEEVVKRNPIVGIAT